MRSGSAGWLAALCACAILPGPLTRAARAQAEPPTIRATTRLLQFGVVALDRGGNPVTGLTKDDLVLLDNGKPREIAFLSFEGGVDPGGPRPRLPAGIFTNRPEFHGGPARNVTALVIDFSNTETADQVYVKAQAMDLLKALAPETRVAVYQFGQGVRVLHDFTADMDSLRRKLSELRFAAPAQRLSDMERLATEADILLKQIGGGEDSALAAQLYAHVAGEVNYNAAVQRDRMAWTLGALEMLGQHLGGIGGRKSLVWISGGLAAAPARVPLSRGRGDQGVIRGAGDNHLERIRRTAEKLAQMGVALYAVDARGMVSPADNLSARQLPTSAIGPFQDLAAVEAFGGDTRSAFAVLSEVTGGRFIFGTNDFALGVRKASADVRGSYLAGFYPGELAAPGWHKLELTSRRPGLRLLHQSGYRAGPIEAPASEPGEEAVRAAMGNPLGASVIRLNARCVRAGGGDSRTVELVAQIDADDLLPQYASGRYAGRLDIAVGEKSAAGGLRLASAAVRMNFTPAQWDDARRKGVPYRRSWTLSPETVLIRVCVREAETGRMGVLDLPVSHIPDANPQR